MRILIVTDAWEPQVNGVVRTIKSTRRELERLGHEVELLTPAGFRTVPCPTYPDIRLSLLPGRRVRMRIRNFAPQALHIATEGPLGLAARAYALRHRLPYTTAYHTRFPEYVHARTRIPLAATYRFLRWFHGPARAVMVPTEVVRRDLLAYGFPASKVVLWARGVELDIFKPGPAMAHDLTRPIFLYVGRVAVEKNIEAFLRLDLPGSKWVAGDGPSLAKLKAEFPEVRFTGVLGQAELATLYNAADVFVFPSRTDTFGLVLLEALACGCPVAAYPVTGRRDRGLAGGCAGRRPAHRRVARAHDRTHRCASPCRALLLGGLHASVPLAPAPVQPWAGRVLGQDSTASRGRRAGIAVTDGPEEAASLESPYKSLGGPGRIWNAIRYSMRGLAQAVRVESAFRQELIGAAILVPLALALALPPLETVALIGAVVLVLIVELVNSSIEAAIDRISFDHHRLSGRAKDLGSAAVFLALLWCASTWFLVAGPALLARLAELIR